MLSGACQLTSTWSMGTEIMNSLLYFVWVYRQTEAVYHSGFVIQVPLLWGVCTAAHGSC